MGVMQITRPEGGIEGLLGIWELQETSIDLLRNFRLSAKEQEEYGLISNERRKCEFLAVRLLLHEMLREKQELYYTDSGKPLLRGSHHISVSHSSELAVVLLTNQPAGIDAENLERNTQKIATRFLSEAEMKHINSTENPAYTRIIYWCAKEAMFKCTSLEGINFRNQIHIDPFLPEPFCGSFTGSLSTGSKPVNYLFRYRIIKNNAVVYCIEKETV